MSIELKIENLQVNDTLNGIDLFLKGGTINALIGKNSSGKTTLLKSIFALTKYKGNISINGVLFQHQNISEIRKNIGIYKGINILENKNVYLNLIEPLLNLDYLEKDAKKDAYEISKKLGIESLLYKEIEKLSYSQKQIVAFARSIIHKPSIILIDNLFDSLNLYYKNKVLGYLKQVKKRDKSIIIFTTNNGEDLLFAENILIIKNGKIVAFDSTKKLMDQENLFIKNNIKLPFIIDLSHKLKSYNLIEELIYDESKMVNEIWQ